MDEYQQSKIEELNAMVESLREKVQDMLKRIEFLEFKTCMIPYDTDLPPNVIRKWPTYVELEKYYFSTCMPDDWEVRFDAK